ncbi:MAG: GNAT family N-acetyltransferase [Fibrobacteraceae bacterium]|nr:GNAT family N-acetyltransferase [Fibrobacteraceae bacterium]
MIQFKPISLADRPIFEKYLKKSEKQDCSYAFANLFAWKHLYHTLWCEKDGFLITRFHIAGSEKIAYLEPLGNGDLEQILSEIKSDADAVKQPLRLAALSNRFFENAQKSNILKDFYFYKNRDLANYIYSAEKLRSLSGKSLHSKRNHIAKFEELYPECKGRTLTREDFPAIQRILDKWSSNQEEENSTMKMEREMIRTALENYEALGLHGVILCANGKAVAFSFGSMINSDTFCVHVEKADEDYKGAFARINQVMAESLPKSVKYINREEDLGLLNLRKAKLSYHPETIAEEYFAFSPTGEEADIWKLWQECFHDGDTFMASYMYPYSDANSRVLLYDEGKLAAMFHVHSFKSSWGQVGYMYGLGTDPLKRGEGLATKVIIDSLKHLKEQGNLAAWVIQENKGFQGWQHRLNFASSGKETLRFLTPDDFDFGGDPEDDWGLCRILNPKKYLERYVEKHPDEKSEFSLEDPIFPENSGTYTLDGKNVIFSPKMGKEIVSPQELLARYSMDDGTELKYIVGSGQH